MYVWGGEWSVHSRNASAEALRGQYMPAREAGVAGTVTGEKAWVVGQAKWSPCADPKKTVGRVV